MNEETLLDFLSMSYDESSGLEVHGNPLKGCTMMSSTVFDPIMFATSESYLPLPKWECSDEGKLSLKIRTNEGSGVILYSSGIKNVKQENGGQRSMDQTLFDFFSIELLDGHVFMLMNQGSGSVRLKATTRRVDDGQWHSISVERKGKSGRVTVDDSGVDFITPGTSAQLDLEGPLFLGGIGGGHHQPQQLRSGQWSNQKVLSSKISSGSSVTSIPSELWAGSLGHGFIGCVRDLMISNEDDQISYPSLDKDGIKLGDIDLDQDIMTKESSSNHLNPIDLSDYLSNFNDVSGIQFGCHSHNIPCEENSCLNGGSCSSGWNRITCNCALTSFTGPSCERPSSMISFNGDQYVRLSLPEESKTQAEDIYVRFKTVKSSGLIMATSSKLGQNSMNHLIILLEHSRIKVILNMGEGNRVINIGNNLNDDIYHSLKIERRGSYLMVKLDNDYQDTPISGQLMTLIIDTIYLASFGRIHISSSSSLYHSTKEVPNFSGIISLLMINNKNLIEMMKNGQLSNYDSTGLIVSGKSFHDGDDDGVKEPFMSVTFKSSNAYIAVLPPKLSSYLSIHFMIKTNSLNGVIMTYGSIDDDDYYSIELENGFIQYTFNLLMVNSAVGGRVLYTSSSNPNLMAQTSNGQHHHHRLHRLSSHSSNPINDDEWHRVTISKSRLTGMATKSEQLQHVLLVDDHLSSIPSPVSSSDAITRSLSSSSSISSVSTSQQSSDYDVEDIKMMNMNTSLHFDLSKRLVYIGAIPNRHDHDTNDDPYPERLKVIGLIGCLASIDLNGQIIDPVNGPDVIVSSSLVEPGCNLDSINTCSFCTAKGKCVTSAGLMSNQQQSKKLNEDKSSINQCDCKMVSYSGITCEEHEGATFKFSGGVLIYTFPNDKKPESKSDELIVGIKTDSVDDCILMRIDSTSSNDYIEVQLIDAHVIVIYNVGSADHLIEDLNVLVNDNNYHMIKFNRSGPNATLQIDNHNIVSRTPVGKQLTIFDAQSTITVGGRKSNRHPITGGVSLIDKPFKGVIFTLTFNNEQILNLGAEGDSRVTLEGRVELLVSISGIKNLNHNHHTYHGHKSGIDKKHKGGRHKDKTNKQLSHEVRNLLV